MHCFVHDSSSSRTPFNPKSILRHASCLGLITRAKNYDHLYTTNHGFPQCLMVGSSV